MSRTAIIVHVFYPELWPELKDCIRNVSEPHDVFITFSDAASVEAVRRDMPEAKFVPCENRGYDIWPFLKVLKSLPSGAYDRVVKLHTKRDVLDDFRYRFNHAVFNGSAWRDYLLAFLRTPEAWRKTRAVLSKPDVGMVADRHVVMRRGDVPLERTKASFDRAVEFLKLPADEMAKGGQYAAGTMFAAKFAALEPLLGRDFSAEDFDPPQGHVTETFAHVMERALGLSVSAAGLRIAAFNGSLRLRRFLFRFRPGRP